MTKKGKQKIIEGAAHVGIIALAFIFSVWLYHNLFDYPPEVLEFSQQGVTDSFDVHDLGSINLSKEDITYNYNEEGIFEIFINHPGDVYKRIEFLGFKSFLGRHLSIYCKDIRCSENETYLQANLLVGVSKSADRYCAVRYENPVLYLDKETYSVYSQYTR